jgi:hypothetical protein
MLMDKAYEGDEMRAKVAENGFIPVVPPKNNRERAMGIRQRAVQATQ